ncbi:FAD-dependent oxidoreductase [Sphaerisporangium rufum]|uniref:FAD-dependent oxidoreductase n=1 Tax=Sphaerisporangium rufum TaxID=1381558 RepID=A0A919RBC4_9ACTN|nr:FAD-dependent monooxygenase [Sphaerisporangium rufum]GII80842.1 FAD-dependent oxidoreductase [Sphaerisporangium rufum]
MTPDVVIAGAGPNGLMLACELSLAGARPVVLERLPARTGENRANGLVGQVVRMLHRRGLHERLTGSPEPPAPTPAFPFGALRLDLASLPDNPLYGLMVPQRRIEEMLEERATELGVEIRRGHELTGLVQDGDGVTAEVAGPGGRYRLRSAYLVGADGGHSPTRKFCGIEFPGDTRSGVVSRTMHLSVPDSLLDPATGALVVPGYGPVPPFMHHRTERGLVVYAPFPGGALISTTEWDPTEGEGLPPLDVAEIRASAARVLGVPDVPFGPPAGDGPHLRRRLGGGNTRLAARYRQGRVLLVGDAAHVHSAIGGPGLNLGLQDAINLGWKLAAEVRGTAPAGLLDSYEAERRPAARRVAMSTRAQSALIAPGGDVTALRELFAELLELPGITGHIAGMMAGADVHYDMGEEAAHPLTGRWAPELSLETDGGLVPLSALTRDARPLLLDLTGQGAFASAVPAPPGRVRVVAARPAGGAAPATALLLRPDCYVAWASAAPAPDAGAADDLRAAIGRWFGPAG